MKTLLALLLLVAVTGCSDVHVRKLPDGTVELRSLSLFTNRGIEEARYGEVYVKGYGSSAATDAIKAAAEGASAGALKAATP